jgi:hypothetical protein
MDNAATERRIREAQVLARAMPREIRDKFEQHLTRKLDSVTERGRAQRQLELENSL